MMKRFVLIALLFALTLSVCPLAGAAPFQPTCGVEAYESLIMEYIVRYGGACWPLDDAVGAVSIRELTGVYPGTPSATGVTLQSTGPLVSGEQAKAAAFDGAAGYVNPASKPTLTQNFTIAFWINPVSLVSYRALVAQRIGAFTGQFFLWLKNLGEITVDCPTGSANGRWSTGVTLSTGLWQHVVVTYDGTNRYLFVNGVQTGPNTARSGALDGTASSLFIARDSAAAQYYFTGSIAYATIIPAALTANEVLALYNGAVKGL